MAVHQHMREVTVIATKAGCRYKYCYLAFWPMEISSFASFTLLPPTSISPCRHMLLESESLGWDS